MSPKSINTAFFVVLVLNLGAQLRTVKPIVTHPKKTDFAIGIGRNRSVVYLNRNVKENNDARGFNVNVIYGGAKLMRAELSYVRYSELNIAPTWLNVNAQTFDANLHFLARFQSKSAVFYPIVGLSYNIFKGYFTGQADNLNLRAIYGVNSNVRSGWVGLNVGTGFEYYFKPMSVFADYKMRIGIAEGNENLNIMDVCFVIGFRYTMRVPSFYALFKGTRSRYFLDKDDSGW